MDSVAFRRNSEFLRANKDDGADIASFELIAIYYLNNGVGDLLWGVFHRHLKDLSAIK